MEDRLQWRRQDNPAGHFVGADLGDALMRAGVFDGAGRMLGKSKRSTKRERGADAVIARLAHCLEEAVDECDLDLGQIEAIGVGVPGLLDARGQTVISAPKLGWEQVPLAKELQNRLGKPVFLDARYQLSGLGILVSEVPASPRVFAAVFCGIELGGGLLFAGESPPEAEQKQFLEIVMRSQQKLAKDFDPASLAHFPSYKLRKAVRRGDPAATAYVLNAGRHAGQALARIVKAFKPETVALGGGVVEEMRQEIVSVIVEAASQELGRDLEREVQLVVSNLGDFACLVGGAFLASQRTARVSTVATGS